MITRANKASCNDDSNISEDVRLKVVNSSGKTAGVRHESGAESFAVDFTSSGFEEKVVKKSTSVRIYTKFDAEKAVVERLLPIYNKLSGLNYVALNDLPPEPADVYIEDRFANRKIGIQVRVSDDKPAEELGKHRVFQRSGTGFTIHHNAIKRAIVDKLKYPPVERAKLILALDGWPGVRKEDLAYFRRTENKFMSSSKYREIWFVGLDEETIRSLFP